MLLALWLCAGVNPDRGVCEVCDSEALGKRYREKTKREFRKRIVDWQARLEV